MNREFWHRRRVRAFLAATLAVWVGITLTVGGPAPSAGGQPLQTIAVSITTDVYGGGLVDVMLRGGQQETVRLAGISIKPCVLAGATAVTRDLAGGRWGYLELSSQQRDTDDNLVGYIWIDTVLLNVELVRNGVAVPISTPSRYQSDLNSARDVARSRVAGGWGNGCLP